MPRDSFRFALLIAVLALGACGDELDPATPDVASPRTAADQAVPAPRALMATPATARSAAEPAARNEDTEVPITTMETIGAPTRD